MTNAALVITGAFWGTYRVNLYHKVRHASLKSGSWFRYLCTVLDAMLFFARFWKTFGLLVRQTEECQTISWHTFKKLVDVKEKIAAIKIVKTHTS